MTMQFDEATAFTDPESEVLVQKAFTELTKHSTVIMIAHRLSTIRNADKIYVLDQGAKEMIWGIVSVVAQNLAV